MMRAIIEYRRYRQQELRHYYFRQETLASGNACFSAVLAYPHLPIKSADEGRQMKAGSQSRTLPARSWKPWFPE
jgi:hypothetical protein